MSSGGTVSFIVRLVDQFSKTAPGIAAAARNIGQNFAGLGRQAAGAHTNVDRLLVRLAGVGVGLLGVQRLGANLNRALTPLIKETAQFDDKLRGIAQTAGIADERLSKLRKTVLEQADAFGEDPDKFLDVLGTLVAAGIDDKTAERLLEPIGKVTVATRSQLNDITQSAIAMVKNLKVPVEEVIAAFEGLHVAGKDGRFELKDVSKHLPQLAALYANLGRQGKGAAVELAAAMQIVIEAGGTPAQGATYLRNLLAHIESPSTVRRFKKAGIDLKAALAKATAEGKSPIEAIIEQTQAVLAKNPKLKVGDLFGNLYTASAVGALVRNYEDFQKIREKALKSQGVIDEDFIKQSETLKKALERNAAAKKAFGVSFAEHLDGPYKSVLNLMTSLIGSLRRFMNLYPAVGSAVAYGALAFIGLSYVISSVSTAVIGLVAAFAIFKLLGGGALLGALLLPFRRLGGLIGLLLLPFRFLLGFIAGFFGTIARLLIGSIARFGLGAVLRGILFALIGGIVGAIGLIPTLIIGALVGLGALGYIFWDKIKAAFTDIDLAATGAAIMNSLLSGLKAAAEAVISWVSGFVGKLKSLFNFHVSPTITPNYGGLSDGPQVIPQSAPGPTLAPRTLNRASVQNNTFNITGGDPEATARAIVHHLDRAGQGGLYDGSLEGVPA